LADGLSQDSASFLLATPQAGREVLAQLEAQQTLGPGQPGSDRVIVREYRATAVAELEMLEELFVAAVRRGCRSLRLVGNVSEGKIGQRKRFSDVTQYEEGYGRLAHRFPIVTLCQYDARRHSGIELCDIMKCHADVFRYPADRLLL
jgi:transcriptional repressor of dcmA and dcmR